MNNVLIRSFTMRLSFGYTSRHCMELAFQFQRVPFVMNLALLQQNPDQREILAA